MVEAADVDHALREILDVVLGRHFLPRKLEPRLTHRDDVAQRLLVLIFIRLLIAR